MTVVVGDSLRDRYLLEYGAVSANEAVLKHRFPQHVYTSKLYVPTELPQEDKTCILI